MSFPIALSKEQLKVAETALTRLSLKPCPFCGSVDLDVTQWVECNGCGAFGPTPADSGDLSAWNTRFEEPKP